MAPKANCGTDNTCYYNISLVGRNAYEPQATLERWAYFTNPGTDTSAPTGWKGQAAEIKGAFIQLPDNTFNPVGTTLGGRNSRYCDQASAYNSSYANYYYNPDNRITYLDINGTIPFNSSNYPCRTSSMGGTWDLLSVYVAPKKLYEKDYLANSARPPGDYLALYQSALIELDVTDNNWTKHNTSLFPAPEVGGT